MPHPHRIDGRARNIQELLDGARFTNAFYQSEYAWAARQVRELVDDLSEKFLYFHRDDHHRAGWRRTGRESSEAERQTSRSRR